MIKQDKKKYYKTPSKLLEYAFVSMILLCFFSCSQAINEPDTSEETVGFMSFNLSTKAGSINTHVEDSVIEIRAIIFDSTTGELVYNHNNSVTFYRKADLSTTAIWDNPIKLKADVTHYDFYFIANESHWGLTAQLSDAGITRAMLDNLQLVYEPGYKPTPNKLFLMTAVYRNIDITQSGAGEGTLRDPYHFRANGDFTVDLIRTLAKIDLTIKGGLVVERTHVDSYNYSFESLDLIQLVNIPIHHKLFLTPFFSADASSLFTNDLSETPFLLTPDMNESEVQITDTIAIGAVRVRDYHTTFYVPEFLRPVSANYNDAALSVEFHKRGESHVSAGINHSQFNLPDDKYNILSPEAYNAVSVLRNTEYKIDAEWLQKNLSFSYNILPWTLKPLHVEFYDASAQMAYLDNWTPSTLTVRERGDVVSFRFRIIEPQGVDWTATLSNGLDFAFRSGTPTRGKTGLEYTVEIIALKPPTTQMRTTEFYLTINGEEIDPDKYINSWGEAQNGPIGIGKGNRYTITQLAK